MNGLQHVQAQASMRLAEAVAVGAGRLKKDDREAITRRWQGSLGRQRRRPRTADELRAAAAASGFAFVRVPAPAKAAS